MSDIKGTLNFILRGSDSLAYKWVKEVRSSGFFPDGINVWALSDYFYQKFFLEKIFNGLYSNYNSFAAEVKKLNKYDSDTIIKYNDKVIIPISTLPVEIIKGTVSNFNDIKSRLSSIKVTSTKQLKEILSDNEIIELSVNNYHINCDVRSKDGIGGKTYTEIINHPALYFDKYEKLIFLLPSTRTITTTKTTTIADKKIIPVESAENKPENGKKRILVLRGHSAENGGAEYTVEIVKADGKKEKKKYYETNFITNTVDVLIASLKKQGFNVNKDPQENYPKGKFGIKKRTAYINDNKDKYDLLVELHFDWRSKDDSGTHVFYPNPASDNKNSFKAASSVKDQLISDSYTGVKLKDDSQTNPGSVGVLQHTKVWSILIELGNGSNIDDVTNFEDNNYIKKWSDSVAQGITNFFK